MRPGETITVVGIGADGWDGLSATARTAIAEAEVLLGSARQLDLVHTTAKKVPWPSPLLPALDGLLDEHKGAAICVLASGDPLLFGIGSTLVRRLGTGTARVIPGVSSVALARARLGWPAEETETLRDARRIPRALTPGRKLLVLSADADTPARVAALLTDRGYGASRLAVLEELAGPDERRIDGTAATWAHPPGANLNVIAVHCLPDQGTTPWPASGLPDDAFEHDGQLTKRDIRAVALARLAPLPGQLLWDVGAGAGSIAVEWLRLHPGNRAIAVEKDPDRTHRIRRNAERLGVPELDIVTGTAPQALDGLTTPDAVFVGGGVSTPGVLDRCWDALRPGGRLVANGVTLQAEAALTSAYTTRGGELTRLAIERAGPLGGLTGWTPARTVTQWSVWKP